MPGTIITTKLATEETLTITGPGEVKIIASKQIAIFKAPHFSLPVLASAAKPTILGLNLMGPALGLVGVTLSLAYLTKLVGDAVQKHNPPA
ncbi:hypothetical protein [Magnetococcus marinus]|nr:hypothetical protein [Magnetococcus marinus]